MRKEGEDGLVNLEGDCGTLESVSECALSNTAHLRRL